ncbi:response regulator transcription factor [Chondrinema litorale]|uniref:response regulator transcription factor n=1 Tax=Chondrinema litorale TaxID=2994555 RepID=UPI0025431AC9|nr:response regulator [Chondrinema litorale]UZR98280.1 response regulator [Chondrinema litorale]
MEKIIFLQDSDRDLQLIKDILIRNDNYVEIILCSDEVSFKELLVQSAPDFIVSDYYMQKMNGNEALMLAKQINPWIPFIFLSNKIVEDYVSETALSNADGYLLRDNIEYLPNILKIGRHNCSKSKKIQTQYHDLMQLSESVDLHGMMLKKIKDKINKMQTQDLIHLEKLMDNIKNERRTKKGA